MRVAPGVVLACAGVAMVATTPAWGTSTDEHQVTEGTLATREGKQVIDVPLEHTEVQIHAAGFLATVEVEQTFHNPYDKKIEAVYLFPLPTGAAVDGMEIDVGGKTIVGEIQEREAAKQTYTRARSAGLVAALLTEERANLFTQSVANIEPGARIVVRLRYQQALDYQDGGYEIVFPMVAGPRYVPKNKAASKQAAEEVAAVQPAVLPPGMRSSHDINVTADIDAGVPITGLRSPSHQLASTPDAQDQAKARVTLAAGDTIPNKDFILRYDVAGERPAFAVRTHRGADGKGAFFLMLQPPASATADEITAKEMVFVIDTSSSMQGKPLLKAKEAVRRALAGMGRGDTFQIVRFSDAASALGDAPIANKPKNVEYALAWLDALEAGGGTEMTEGIAAALGFPHDPARLRIVMFLTDGYIGNEDEILAQVAQQLGDARLFSFGVGSAVNRYLLEEMATLGRGAVQVVRPDEDTTAAVEKFHARIARPVLTDITIDWHGLAVTDTVPARVPDLFLGQPIVLSGHYATAGAATITVRGTAAGRAVSFAVPVELPAASDAPAVATVWARARIAELQRAQIRGEQPAAKDEILALGLAHHLMTPYTAFVAVDTSRMTKGGEAKRVAVPVEVPDGLTYTEGQRGYGYASVGVGASGSYGRGDRYGGDRNMAKRAAPAVQISAVRAEGALDKTIIRRYVTTRKAEVQRCYELAQRTTPDLEGTVTLRIRIDASGDVTAAAANTPEGGEELGRCVAERASTWKFPTSDTGATVTYPFVFRKGGDQ